MRQARCETIQLACHQLGKRYPTSGHLSRRLCARLRSSSDSVGAYDVRAPTLLGRPYERRRPDVNSIGEKVSDGSGARVIWAAKPMRDHDSPARLSLAGPNGSLRQWWCGENGPAARGRADPAPSVRSGPAGRTRDRRQVRAWVSDLSGETLDMQAGKRIPRIAPPPRACPVSRSGGSAGSPPRSTPSRRRTGVFDRD
jgi:hypothetical protein